MIRIFLAMAALAGVSLGEVKEVMKKEIYEKDGISLPYRWLKTEGEGKPALVLFLHGAGERGDDNEAQLRHGVGDLLAWLEKEKKAAVVVAPQCKRGVWWADLEGDFRAPEGAKLSKEPSLMLSMVFEVLDEVVKREAVDLKRVYVTGLSMGGFGTFASVAYRPDFFAAAVPVCGGGDPAMAQKMKGVPFWVFHGDRDRVVPRRASEIMVEALRKAGGEVKFESYPGVGHDSWTQTYGNAEVWAWLFGKSRK